MSKTFTMLAMALLLASPAAAGHDGRRPSDLERLRRSVSRLEYSVVRLCQEAARDLRRRSPRQQQVLHDLDYLAGRAKRFNQRLGKYARRPHKLRREIKRLNAAFVHAQASVHELRHARQLKHDFRQVARLMDRVAYGYEGLLVARRDRRHDQVSRAPREHGPRDYRRRSRWNVAQRWSYGWY